MTKYAIPSKCLDRAAKVLDSATKNHDLQNVIGLVSSSKETLLSHASGASFEDSTVKINSNSIFAIASMTKLVTTIAVLQLVENNQIGLLDEIESYIPELKNLNILQSIDQGGHANYLKPERSPLIKELITHTSGYAYSMWNEKIFISDNLKITSSNIDYLETPLTFEPGTRWEYGIGIDILGILIERVTNLPLEEYFIKNIFFPLSMNDTSFSIEEGKRDRVLSMMKRDSKGLMKSDLFQPEFNNLDSPMVHGGGGLYSTVIDFAQLLRTLLNQGTLK
jgi:methyl acetate hydrolase